MLEIDKIKKKKKNFFKEKKSESVAWIFFILIYIYSNNK